jgi:uncharacterized NAD(P)/FAD-binding protein YdhS
LLFALYPLTPAIWQLLNNEDQVLFMKQHYGLFITYLAAFPLDNAYKIKELLNTNQLEVLSGITTLDFEDNQFKVAYQDGQIIQSNWLINATGFGYNASAVLALKTLLFERLLSEHPLGGIKVDRHTLQTLDVEGKVNSHVYAVGELTKGDYFLTTDLGCVTAQTKRVAVSLAKQIDSVREHEKVNVPSLGEKIDDIL